MHSRLLELQSVNKTLKRTEEETEKNEMQQYLNSLEHETRTVF